MPYNHGQSQSTHKQMSHLFPLIQLESDSMPAGTLILEIIGLLPPPPPNIWDVFLHTHYPHS